MLSTTWTNTGRSTLLAAATEAVLGAVVEQGIAETNTVDTAPTRAGGVAGAAIAGIDCQIGARLAAGALAAGTVDTAAINADGSGLAPATTVDGRNAVLATSLLTGFARLLFLLATLGPAYGRDEEPYQAESGQ